MSSDAKLIQVSRGGVNFHTLPGSSGEISIESSDNDNTIYGNVFSSSIPGVKDWSLTGNAWLRETPGFNATVKRQGVATAFTGEAMQLVDGTTYEITDSSKNLWDFTSGVSFDDGGSPVSDGDIEQIDYLFGRVTFKAGAAPTGSLTVDGKYSPVSSFGCANNISLTQNAEATLSSCFEIVQAENGFNTYDSGLKTVSMELSGFYRTTNDFFTVLTQNETVVIEVDWEGDGNTLSRGVFKLQSTSQSGDVGSQEEYSASFTLFVPEDTLPFSWYFGADSNAPQGMREIMDSWITRENLHIKYFPIGNSTGSPVYKGETVVTDASLSTSVDAIGEMSLTVQGDGELTNTTA